MSQTTNHANINYSTAFTTDKICMVLNGSYNAANYNTVLGGYLYQTNFAHNLTRPCELTALFSIDNTNWIPQGQASSNAVCNLYSDASNFYILNLANSGTFYYKIIGTWIDNYDNTNPLITPVLQLSTSVNSKTFDSRYNYQKIFLNQMYTLNNPGVGNTGTYTINHNLGYAPNYKLFFESLPNTVWNEISGGTQDFWFYDTAHQYELYGVMNTTSLTLTYHGGSSSASTFRVWVKIYYDQ